MAKKYNTVLCYNTYIPIKEGDAMLGELIYMRWLRGHRIRNIRTLRYNAFEKLK